MTRPELPPNVRYAMWALRGGLAVAGLGIIGFFLSYSEVGAPSLASADYHAIPTLAWLSIVAWFAGMGVALAAGWHVRGVARGYARTRDGNVEEEEDR